MKQLTKVPLEDSLRGRFDLDADECSHAANRV